VANYYEISLPEAIKISGAHKAVSAACGVNLRTVYRWAECEKPIPAEREEQIRAAIDSQGGTVDKALAEVGEIAQGLLESWADGRITPAELVMIQKESGEAILELVRARRLARARREGGAG